MSQAADGRRWRGPAPRHLDNGAYVPPPEVRSERFTCPRCATHLRSDGDELFCLTCGYAHPHLDGDTLSHLPLSDDVREAIRNMLRS